MLRKSLLVLSIIALLIVAVPTVGAQDNDDQPTVTFTEAEVNGFMAERDGPGTDRFSSTSIDLQPGQIVYNATFSPAERDESVAITAVIIPQYANDFIGWALASLTVNGDPVDGELAGNFAAGILQGIAQELRARTAQDILAVAITENDITFTLSQEPRDPIGDFDREAGTYTVTEAELNGFEAPTNRPSTDREQLLSDPYIDLQPDQVVISALLTPRRDGAEPSYISVVVVPSVTAAGFVDWDIVRIEFDPDAPAAVVMDRISEALVNDFTRSLGADRERRATITDLEITDTDMTYTLVIAD